MIRCKIVTELVEDSKSIFMSRRCTLVCKPDVHETLIIGETLRKIRYIYHKMDSEEIVVGLYSHAGVLSYLIQEYLSLGFEIMDD